MSTTSTGSAKDIGRPEIEASTLATKGQIIVANPTHFPIPKDDGELRNLVIATIDEEDPILRHSMVRVIQRAVGRRDGIRYWIRNEYHTCTSIHIRNPSRAWPLSHLRHVATQKYLKALIEEGLGQ